MTHRHGFTASEKRLGKSLMPDEQWSDVLDLVVHPAGTSRV